MGYRRATPGCNSLNRLYNRFDEVKSVKNMTWRQQNEGLDSLCTVKGSHTGSVGKIVYSTVVISFNKRVILWEQ